MFLSVVCPFPVPGGQSPTGTGNGQFRAEPRLPLADLVLNPTPPGQIVREQALSVCARLGRDSISALSAAENSCKLAVKVEIDCTLIL